jgi:tRNA:m4X modification enzyme
LIDKHLLKCNAAKKIKPNCYSYNINSGLCDYVPSHEEKLTLSEFSETKIAELLGRIDDSLAKLNENIQTMILDHPVMKDELANDSNGPTALKHLQQQSSIIGHLDSSKLLSSKTHYIEFGAGRGKLSHWLQLALQGDDSVHFTLVDRANCRRKVVLMINVHSAMSCYNLRCTIEKNEMIIIIDD